MISWKFWAISDSASSPTSVQEGPAQVLSGMKGTLRRDTWYELVAQCRVGARLVDADEAETFDVVSVSVPTMCPDHQLEQFLCPGLHMIIRGSGNNWL